MYKPKHDKKQTEMAFTGFYRGEVVDVEDPYEAGRVKIKVFSIYDDFSIDTIPWAIMADPFMGGQEGFGGFFVPDMGSHVWVFFEQGDPEQPVYFAGAPARPHGPPERKTDYPLNHVYRTVSDHVLEINDGETGNIKITHRSGTTIEIDKDGNLLIDVVGNVEENVAGDYTITVVGDYSVTARRIDLN